jgi:serine/threonine-protein kinase
MRSVRLLATIDEPQVVKIFTFGTSDKNEYFMVMELLEGETLDERVARKGPLSPREACYIGQQIARAMHEVHQHEVIHRNIKPNNILLVEWNGKPDFVKIMDFDVAKREGEGMSAFSKMYTMPSDVDMKAPEQIRGEPTDVRTDVYGLGMTLYLALTGMNPFEAHEPMAVMRKILNTWPPVASVYAPGSQIPARLDALIDRAMQKEAGKRFKNMAAMGRALAGIPFDPPLVMPELVKSQILFSRELPMGPVVEPGPVSLSDTFHDED